MKPLRFGYRDTQYTKEPPPYMDEEVKKNNPFDPPNRERSYWGRTAIEDLDRIYTYDNLFSVDSLAYFETEPPWSDSVGDWETAQIKKRQAEQKELKAKERKETEEAEKEAEAQAVAFQESQRIRITTSPADFSIALRLQPKLLYVNLKLCPRILCSLWDTCARGVKHPDQEIGRKITKDEFLGWLKGPDV